MRLASYGQKKESSGEVLLLGDVPRDFEARAVLLVDDIVDTGLSMAYGKRLLTERHASQVRTCALLDKPSRRQVEVAIDFVGFEIPTCSWSATASTTPSSTAICRISARCVERRALRSLGGSPPGVGMSARLREPVLTGQWRELRMAGWR